MRLRWSLILLLVVGCAGTVRVSSLETTPDALGHWFILHDPQGHDHILYCVAKALHTVGAEEPAACYDLTPRANGTVGPVGTPLRSTKP